MLQFGSKHVGIEDVHILKHCREMTGLLLWIGTYCISCVVQQINRVKDLSSLVRYDNSCLAAIRHVQSIIRIVRPRPNIRSHNVLLFFSFFYFFGSRGKKNNAWYIYLTSSQPPPNLHNLTSVWPVMLLANKRLPYGNQILARIMSLLKSILRKRKFLNTSMFRWRFLKKI